MVGNLTNNQKIAQLQVGYMSYPGFNQNKVFTYQLKGK